MSSCVTCITVDGDRVRTQAGPEKSRLGERVAAQHRRSFPTIDAMMLISSISLVSAITFAETCATTSDNASAYDR